MLGRVGDILNIIPAVEYEARQHNYKPKVISARQYAGVLDGFDYLEKEVYPGEYWDITGAIAYVYQNFPGYKLINCSVYGKNYKYDKQCNSFLREAWRFTQCPIAWGALPLIITNRDIDRELEINERLEIDKITKPIVLTALRGNSSPFDKAQKLLNKLNERLGNFYHILDISEVKAEQIYDLLTLYEKADCLIAIDSAPLHLAEAVQTYKKLPVISLISDLKDKWHQSSWRREHILRVLYSEVFDRIDEIIQAVKQRFNYKRPTIHLVTSSAINPDKDTQRRYSLAHISWLNERKLAGLDRWRFHYYPSNNNIPKVKKMIDYAAEEASDDDIILITNADICFVPGISGWILHETDRHEAVYFHRHDFEKITNLFISESQVGKGKWYAGSDVFAFTKRWWNKHKEIYPDMYYAREAWDMVMRNMIKRSKGTEIHKAIYHEKHKSFWEAKENRNCPENLHNRALGQDWLNRYGGNWNDWKFNKLTYYY